MKQLVLIVSCLALVACGGSKKAAVEPTPVAKVPAPEPEPEPEPVPPPQEWSASAALAPVKGAKLKPGAVRLTQTEGEGVRVVTTLTGLAAGTYHLVVHESADCGKNATKIGPAFGPAAEVALAVAVAKGKAGELDTMVELQLDGDDAIVGRTLVVHADKKGKPGAVVACGPIVLDADDADDDEE
ncbi:MAG: superoxide dismutase family protein [Kofleriaceae bacterium]|nr:superoxide dismutase family protein [Kofleriaceae bacterium]MCL4225033.1 superoxide dismutase family protein [Myxococcales bacterium]